MIVSPLRASIVFVGRDRDLPVGATTCRRFAPLPYENIDPFIYLHCLSCFVIVSREYRAVHSHNSSGGHHHL